MFEPSIKTERKLENSYMLASITGKRAIQLMKGSTALTDCESYNTVTIAICEYKEGKLAYMSNTKNTNSIK